jgi:type II secretory pathway pseudopilin PulG
LDVELARERRRSGWLRRTRRPERPDARRRYRGVTLIEVPIAMTMLAFGLLAMAPVFTGAVRTNASANQLTNANTLAREKMEELIGFPSTDARLWVDAQKNAAGPTGTTTTGSGSIVMENTICDNDLPDWYKPSTGETYFSQTSPGVGWFAFPYTRTYTVEQFREDLTTRVVTPSPTCAIEWGTDTCPGTFGVKLLTVVVRPTSGPFPGLRKTTQSVYVRFRNASPN